MSKVIYKYELEITDTQTVKMPAVISNMLCAMMQGDKLCVWAEVEANWPLTDREFKVVGTGHEIDFATDAYSDSHTESHFKYINTVMQGPFVWHIYWR
jgi:hypothetical protein